MIKKILPFIIFVTTLNCLAQEKNFIDKPYIEITSEVDTLITPDKIYLTIHIKEEDTKGKISVEELENKMFNKLKSIGIDLDKQLTLSDLNSSFKNYFLRGSEILKNKEYKLLVFDAQTAAKVFIGLENEGISNVSIEKTEYSKLESLKLVLMQIAVRKAQEQGQKILEPLDQTLGKAIYISNLNTDITNLLQGKVAGVQIRGYSSVPEAQIRNTNIDFEKIKVKANLKINFAIE